MAKGYLIDTNIFTLYTQDELSEKGNELVDSIFNSFGCQISVITRIELLSWNTDPKTMSLVNEFIRISKEFSLTEDIIINTAEMRRRKKIRLPDAVIAATAMVNDLILLSDNDKDFGKIEHLRYLNPRKL
ncbi:type II toxin-antitoxin system VapC family toxin [Arcicella sp. DC2W]|uniref:Type II toxin-antitoxin system VapC family toxin n=1 Tax=Arcicella gelida TaxID=2984195 RepID=A0ABU5SAC0_9BACT|nr:type II toxin-antitoxin system VapC family toxin [Arcicella sp. DC2W]MEA5405153.1 type II toxin-antitoxin system VapC family toxin [Arcicella sp. DC2W]